MEQNCSTCHQTLPLTEYSWKSKARGIRHKRCKRCVREHQQKWYSANRETQLQRVADDKKRKRAWWAEYKTTLRCQVCGENDPVCLDLHHRDPLQKDASLSNAIWGWGRDRIDEELAKCDVLCANCHRKVHATKV